MKRVVKTGNSEIVEKKSRFIGIALDVESADDAAEKISAIRRKYYDARHNCYAYICGEHGEQKKFSDDGEPSGTAGKPMMDVLEGSGVTNCLIVVTRYFGGTLLGTGGLVRAYGSAAKQALEDAETAEVMSGIKCTVAADYNSIGKLQHIFSSLNIPVTDTAYGADVTFTAAADDESAKRLEKALCDEFSGKLELKKGERIQFYKDGKILQKMF